MANRPNILALASKISLESMTYTGITYKDPEYRILEPIVDDDMCSVMSFPAWLNATNATSCSMSLSTRAIAPTAAALKKPYFRARIFSSARYTYPKTENIWAPCLPWSPSAYKKSETFLCASKTPHFL